MEKCGKHWNYKLLIGKRLILSEGMIITVTNVYEKIKDLGYAFGQAHRAHIKISELR